MKRQSTEVPVGTHRTLPGAEHAILQDSTCVYATLQDSVYDNIGAGTRAPAQNRSWSDAPPQIKVGSSGPKRELVD